ncbi:MAG TPA: sulfatase-like hydrolase/transferase, partial [bacterium]|nr:sulfatase-like hydrolase/transferase [bacterium]
MSKTTEKGKVVMEKKNAKNKEISDRPNVILILTDDLAWSDLGCYGSKFNLTPNLDNLASKGIRFINAYASSPVCSPSRASLLTGKSPARLHFTHITQTGISRNLYWESPKFINYLPTAESTIAIELKKKGYATAIIGKWHIGGYGKAPEETGDP